MPRWAKLSAFLRCCHVKSIHAKTSAMDRTLQRCARLSVTVLGIGAVLTHAAMADTTILFQGSPSGTTINITTDDPRELINGDFVSRTDGAFERGTGWFAQDPHDGQDYLAAGSPATDAVDEIITFFPAEFVYGDSPDYHLMFGPGPGTPCSTFEEIVDQGFGCSLQETWAIQDIATVFWSDGGVDHIEYQFVPEPAAFLLLGSVVAASTLGLRRRRTVSSHPCSSLWRGYNS
jgi:hypothetical protein